MPSDAQFQRLVQHRAGAFRSRSQLPPLLRGLYYEGWHPSTRGAARNRTAFLERIHDSLHREPGIDPEQIALAVFAMLAARLPAAEVEDAKAATPKSLHNLWPS
jgi:uncharacterized protein (DUF2267 family)